MEEERRKIEIKMDDVNGSYLVFQFNVNYSNQNSL
jgi:hypothetical protein